MIAVGIDVSKGRSTVAVVGEGKKVIEKPVDILHTKANLLEFVAKVKALGDDVRVVMEYTGVYYKVVADVLHKAGIRVSVVNPVLIKQFGDNKLRKVNTDKTASMKIARYALENRDELPEYDSKYDIRDTLKSFVKQFEFEDKTLTAHKNNLNALMERVFPGLDGFFRSLAKSNGHQKRIDFIIAFWHNDCVSGINECKFVEKYSAFCKKNRYQFNEKTAKEVHVRAKDNLTSMPKNNNTKLLIQGAAKRVLRLSEDVERLRSKMIELAKMLPEFDEVNKLYGVGETLAAKLISEIGDVRRFTDKRALVAFAGIDPEKNDSGLRVSSSDPISRRGDSLLRKIVFQVVEKYLINSPEDEPVYQFLDKKRSEGKHYYVYMTAAGNKFLRIYYARIKNYLNSLDSGNQTLGLTNAS